MGSVFFARSAGFTRFVAIVAFSLGLIAQNAYSQDKVERLGVPGPVEFDNADYSLAWSSNPSPTYFKQEYLPQGQDVESYTSMLIVELALGVDVNTAISAQVSMLDRRRTTDPLVNFDILQNEQSGEAILDFIVSSKDTQGEYIVEWNAYRYAPWTDGKRQGVALFAISHRAYGNEKSRAFLGSLQALRPQQINVISKQEFPAITPIN